MIEPEPGEAALARAALDEGVVPRRLRGRRSDVDQVDRAQPEAPAQQQASGVRRYDADAGGKRPSAAALRAGKGHRDAEAEGHAQRCLRHQEQALGIGLVECDRRRREGEQDGGRIGGEHAREQRGRPPSCLPSRSQTRPRLKRGCRKLGAPAAARARVVALVAEDHAEVELHQVVVRGVVAREFGPFRPAHPHAATPRPGAAAPAAQWPRR